MEKAKAANAGAGGVVGGAETRGLVADSRLRGPESNSPVHFYWYDDRIEIQNPGGLYGMASPENFPRQTDYRNPVIAEAMATLGSAFHRTIRKASELRDADLAFDQGDFESIFRLGGTCRPTD